MKIHEYQGKKIFSDYGMPVQDGYIFEKIEDAEKTIKRVQKDFNTEEVVVKAQIHAGGRGKGGGVKYSENFEKAFSKMGNKVIKPTLRFHNRDFKSNPKLP